MSSPIHQAKDLDPVLEYAPQWARDRAQAPTDDVAAPPIEWPPPGRRLDNVCILGDDRAALEARRELALQPEKVPEPPQPDAGDQIVGKTVLAVCGVAGVAAVVAWTLVSTLDGGSLKHEAAQASSPARPIAVNSKQNDAPAAPATTLPTRPSTAFAEDDLGQEPRKLAILGVPAAVVASTMTERAPAAAQELSTVQRTPPGLITRQMDRDEVAFLVRRGENFVNSGDLAAARLMLRRAAEAGDVHAALVLATTFDPNIIRKLGIQGLAADAAMARLWYERAAQFGSAEAPQRLQQLATQVDLLP